jgi:hypothetical protein
MRPEGGRAAQSRVLLTQLQRVRSRICQVFHPYLTKYLAMICQGHVSFWNSRMNKDMLGFIRYFLPKGEKATRKNVLMASGFRPNTTTLTTVLPSLPMQFYWR